MLEEELLIVDGLHPAPDPYDDPKIVSLDFKYPILFIPDDVHAIPLNRTRSASTYPSDLPSSSVPRSNTPLPLQSYSSPFPQGTLVIEVVQSFKKRAYIEEVRNGSLPPLEATPDSIVFPAPVLPPRLGSKVGDFKLSQIVNWSDIDTLSIRLTPAIVTAMMEKYENMAKNLETTTLELQEALAKVLSLQRGLEEEGARFKDLKAEIQWGMSMLKSQVDGKKGGGGGQNCHVDYGERGPKVHHYPGLYSR
ncbi:hypothetical protein Salat_2124900 [Sesamum alatum]|uniref:Uncharacterized protein n=1 Tax=Sesamum alatum TaxID=300844 RepID=A0AAE2CGW4_9LAMI|nr:hypothetical protein Salat_2124900 [Sesamum alatum]